MGDTTQFLQDGLIILVFMAAISMFRTPSGARRGNILTALAFGVAIALVFVRNTVHQPWLIALVFLIGAIAGFAISHAVTMTRIPALIALQNGAGGGASLLVSTVELTRAGAQMESINTVFGYIGIMVGAVALSGSVLAALKLEGKVNPRPKTYQGHNVILLLMLLAFLGLALLAESSTGGLHIAAVIVCGLVAILLGIVFAVRIGGADMPVLISFLNTLSGLAAAFVGVTLGNQMLIAAGAMVGASGLILTMVMCRSMNRTLWGVLTGHSVTKAAVTRMASPDAPKPQPAEQPAATDPLAAAKAALDTAQSVIIVPGYGMAQARAQFEVASLAEKLKAAGKTVRFAVHPVAGRMPGHMHVLLAEADVDYDDLFEMDAINDDFATTDVALIVGASDVVNPAAIDVPDTPISGMPILNAHLAKTVIVCNLDAKPGYSGVENPLYDDPRTILLFGDAKETVSSLLDD